MSFRFLTFVLAATTAFSTAPAMAGIDTNVVLTTEADSVVSGGLNRGVSGLSNLDLTAHWQGDNGWEAFGYVLGDFGDDFSANRVGDVQVTSNIDSVDGWRLFEAYGKKSWGDKGSVMAGLINLNAMFDVQDVGSVFFNASHGIGIDYSQSGPSIFPISALGVVGEWQITPHQALRAGLFDGVPGNPYDDRAFAYIKLSAEEGAHYAGEYQYDFDGGFVKLGAWANTARLDRLDGSGTSRGNNGAYGQVGFTLTREGSSDDQGLKGWVRAGVANDTLMTIDHYAGGGVVYTGAFKGRDSDQTGLAVAVAHFGAPYRASVDEDLISEVTWEAIYRYDLNDRVSLQPDLQYVQHPSGRSDIDNALVLQLRVKVGMNGL